VVLKLAPPPGPPETQPPEIHTPIQPLTCADQQSIAQPGLEELVLGGLVDIDVAAQQQLHVPGIIDEDHQLGPDPHLGYVLEGGALPDDCFENSCRR